MDLPASPIEGVFTARGAFDDRALRRAHARGEVVRIRRGAYVSVSAWASADARGRDYLRIAAVAASRGFVDVFSHESAAVLRGLSTLSETALVHVLDPQAATTRTISGLVVHAGPADPRTAAEPPAFRVTGLARTLADVALTAPFADAVAVLDSGLRRAATPARQSQLRAAVVREVESSGRVRGRSRALRALDFADPGAANAGESLSRVLIAQLGFAAPTSLQERFDDERGQIGYTDFWWRDAGVVGEFDGFVKYSKPEYLDGRSPSQVVVDEKARERRLEALPQVRRVARWVWADLMTPSRLFRELSAAGVPRAPEHRAGRVGA